MTGPEHYKAAEECIADALGIPSANDETNPAAALLLAEAQVHATLALAAATVLTTPSGVIDRNRKIDAWSGAGAW